MPLRPQRLPGQIAAVMAGTIAVFLVTLGVSVVWIAQAMDRQAREGSSVLVQKAVSGLLAQVGTSTLDYAKWDEAAARVAALDRGWLFDNFAATAGIGQTAQVVLLRGGPLGDGTAWVHDGPGAPPRAGAFDPATLAAVEAALDAIPPGAFEAAGFFVPFEGRVVAAAAARVDHAGAATPPLPRDRAATLLMARHLSDATLAEIGRSTLLEGLALARAGGDGRLELALPGPDGRPAGHLSWTAPRPGTDLLSGMLAVLLPVTLLATGLGLAGLALARRNAQNLVRAENAALAAALTDPLTGLPNRAAFTAALAAPARAGERAVLLLDVRGFKRINDSLGHAAGDEVVRRLAARLGGLAAPDCLLARVGGDEFVYVVSGADAAGRADWLAHAAERALAPPMPVGGHALVVQVSMGIAVQDRDGQPGEELVRHADLALGEAKRRPEGGPVAFGAMIAQAAQDAGAVESALAQALGREGELWVAYQPMVDACGRGLARAEALARWTSPTLGVVPPDSFIAVAERAGLIGRLGWRLLRIVCDDLVAHPDLRVSVNVSPIQLLAPDFVPDLLALLATRGIDPARIEVEITEGVVLDDLALAARRARSLREAGLSMALDDFGTGFSSIGTLRRVEFDVLKIDRSFVSGLVDAPERRALVEAMVLLAHALGLRVVCEGVETNEELETLRAMGCDLMQGFGIARPMAIEALAARWLGAAQAEVA